MKWHVSHPSRVRGLKLNSDKSLKSLHHSHPSRVRGLKQPGTWNQMECDFAPITGARIETLSTHLASPTNAFAPITGARVVS